MTETTQWPTTIPSDEYMKLIYGFQQHHALFYQFWLMGKPVFSNLVKTAAVAFDPQNGKLLNFIINYDFWKTLTIEQKQFVMAHECLHVVLNHGLRGIGDGYINSTINKAMDIVVNHTLMDSFGFNREACDPTNKYCWIDTVFLQHAPNIKEHETFEYYLNQLNKLFPPQPQSQSSKKGDKGESGGKSSNGNSPKPEEPEDGEPGQGSGGEVLDDHSFEDFESVIKEIGENLSNEDKQSIKDLIEKHMKNNDENSLSRGTIVGGMKYLVPGQVVKPKKKWETIIKRWMYRVMQEDERSVDQWLRTNRRHALLDSDLILPSEFETDDLFEDKKKILVYFFQDTSGSCLHLKDRFFKAAESLPKERFEVKMHCFDTEVYETSLETRELYGFGGTAFDIIEKYIQGYIQKNNLPYPEKVFIITDGDGNKVKPEKPKNWEWFLTQNGTKKYIPEESGIHNLSDYE